ncbi:MAG: gamma-glutamyl-gamma-aminobutyrate hydrolase family protein [Gammaproteobacteria bacterium]|nr:gamma-glutamyl-gamma-aminobutyrate hydrolase family protein [Gammaproteobacteria bacterium]
MKAHIFQHVSFEGPGSIDLWLHARQAHVTTTRFYEHDALPALNDVDLLIIMGGPMSVNDEATLPWLHDEKRFIAEAIAASKAVFGVCLGAQLIASALGARVYPGLQKEIGWFDIVARPQQVAGNADNDQTLFQLPDTTRVFHWHGETFTLPDEATRLAGSAACALQAFQYGNRVIGLQCHLETTPADAEALLTHCREELAGAQGGVYVQTPAEIRAEPVETYRQMTALLTSLLDFITRP